MRPLEQYKYQSNKLFSPFISKEISSIPRAQRGMESSGDRYIALRSILVISHRTKKKIHSYYLWLTNSDDGKFWQMLLKNQKNALKILKYRLKKGAKCDRCDCDIKRVFGESLSCSAELFSSFVSVKSTVIRKIKRKKTLMALTKFIFLIFLVVISIRNCIKVISRRTTKWILREEFD